VLSLLVVIAGGVAVFTLPIAQYPDITPPMVQVTAFYPGADPQVVADTVASPIEQEVNGVENMLYMQSTSCADGSYTLKVTFELGTDIDMATVLVQNRVARAMAKLPTEVQRQGVSSKKASTTLVSVVSLYSPDGKFDDLFLANYVLLNVKDKLSRIRGVGDVAFFPTKDYGMRIWLDPAKMEARRISVNDVMNALSQQNVQVAAGQIGQPPAPKGQAYQLTIRTLGRLSQKEQFEDIVVKTGEGARLTRVKDVARVELGGKSYETYSTINGSPAATVLVYQSPGSNALNVADEVRETMKELQKDFPKGLEYRVVYEVSAFVRASIDEVVKTLFEAFVLVFIVVFLFLQDWRATLIPAITIPVSLIGTFAVMTLFGFSINMVTLFGLVLAIGIVVDDAIVVVENVERNMTTRGLGAKDAALKAMEEVSGAIIGITLVLMAVFVPAAFMSGITGQLYRQFSLTIAVTTFFSALNALTLSPALCALLLKPHHEAKRNAFFRAFNATFDRMTNSYTSLVSLCVRRLGVMGLIFVGLLVATFLGFIRVPTGFVPLEDDGLVMINVQLPDGASQERTRATLDRVSQILKETNGVADNTTLGGFSLLDGNGANLAFAFAALKPWEDRLPHGRSRDVIMAELQRKFAAIQEGIVFAFSMPAIPGLGTGGGFEMFVEDRRDRGLRALENAATTVAVTAEDQSRLQNVYATFRADVPTIFADVDRVKALNMGVPLESVFEAMQSYLGSAYVNDFNKFNRTWQVMVQADSIYRAKPEDIKRLQVRNSNGAMVPLGSLVTVRDALGPSRIDRYQMYPAARVSGEPAPGVSSGQALSMMEQICQKELPSGIGYEWTGMSYQEKKGGTAAALVFGMAIIVVFLILAAQYESWADPFGVVLIVPLAVLGAVVALLSRGMDNNVYTQIGLVLLVGLSAKNAILIVEFARDMRKQGKSVLDAAIEGAKLRLRPILMTSLAFCLGVVPLAIASGAGAVSRQALGTAVLGGMLGVTLLGIVFTPVLYVMLQWRKG
jgi:HAE1 family hydrophobic/amphiphilic exporter-1